MAAGPSVAVSEARPESFLAAEKDLRDWLPFQDFFFFVAALEKMEQLETGKMAGQGQLRELDSNSQ